MNNIEIEQLIMKSSSGMTEEEEKVLYEHVTNKPDDPDEAKWKNNIILSAGFVEKYLGDKLAVELLEAAYDSYKQVYPSSFINKVEILKKTCLIQLKNNWMSDAHKTMNCYLFNTLGQVQFGTPHQAMRYYSFRGISDYALDEIKYEKITLAHPREFNDPLDTILVWWLNNEIKKGESKDELELKYRLLMKKASEHIKMRCLIGAKYKEDGTWKERAVEDLSVLMWAHYANSHRGMCLEYEFDKKIFKSGITTSEEEIVMLAPIEYAEVISFEGEPSMKQALFQKSNFWEYEHEMRLCNFNTNETEEFPSIRCEGALKAVYLGEKCSDVDRRRVEVAIGDKDIALYQMSVDEDKKTRFKKTQIG